MALHDWMGRQQLPWAHAATSSSGRQAPQHGAALPELWTRRWKAVASIGVCRSCACMWKDCGAELAASKAVQLVAPLQAQLGGCGSSSGSGSGRGDGRGSGGGIGSLISPSTAPAAFPPLPQALPLFLDRLADPITAVLLSVTVVLVFGEIIPQAVCSRYGLKVRLGARAQRRWVQGGWWWWGRGQAGAMGIAWGLGCCCSPAVEEELL